MRRARRASPPGGSRNASGGAGLVEAARGASRWRIAAGPPRMGVDFDRTRCPPRRASRTRSTARRAVSSARSRPRRSATSDTLRGSCSTFARRAAARGRPVLADGGRGRGAHERRAAADGARTRSPASGGMRVRTAPRTADRSPSAWPSPFGSFRVPHLGVCRTACVDPFPPWSLRVFLRPRTDGDPGGGAVRCGSSVSRRRFDVCPGPHTARFLAGPRGVLRHRPRRLLPDLRRGGRPRARLLQRLPIREECLAWALKNGERYGVWGGLTEQQRRRLPPPVA